MNTLKHFLSIWRVRIALLAAVGLAILFHLYAPPQHNPFRPLSLDDPVGMATYSKFTNLKYDPEACFSALDEVAVQYTYLENEVTGEDCGFTNALTLGRTRVPYSAPLRMTCSLTAALYTWERHTAQPLAEDLFGEPLARIETYGTYSCRNVAGTRRRSEHATANAIDISGFRLADGRLIDVKTHWGTNSDEDRFLKRAHREACRLFSVTLGPDYNAAHEDHFHLDFGSGNSCR